jgi:hypothetical protein
MVEDHRMTAEMDGGAGRGLGGQMGAGSTNPPPTKRVGRLQSQGMHRLRGWGGSLGRGDLHPSREGGGGGCGRVVNVAQSVLG